MPAAPRLRTEIVDPKPLDDAARARLVDRVYAVASQVFTDVTPAEVAASMVGPAAERIRIVFFVAPGGADVGLQCIQLYVAPVRGRASHVFRAQAGMLPAWRGGARTVGLGVREYLQVWLSRPWRPVYYLGVLIHPSSYGLFAEWTGGRLWPSPARATPPEWQQALEDIGRHFRYVQPYADRPLVRRVAYATRDSEAEQRYWRQSDKPAARFHLQQVPHRERGEGLLTLVPLGPGVIAGVAARLLAARLRALWPAPRREGTPAAAEADAALARSTLFAPLPADERAALRPLLQWRTLRGGETLFRQGDAGDALYLVVRGSAYVALADGAGGERLVDALAPGEVLGEIAVLTGQPRSAGVRAAGRLQLLRLAAADLHALMARHPALAQRLWQAAGRRLLRGLAWDHPRLAGLALDARDARLQAVQARTLATGEALAIGSLGVLVHGQLQADDGTPPLQAPALLDAGRRVQATTPAVLALLP